MPPRGTTGKRKASDVPSPSPAKRSHQTQLDHGTNKSDINPELEKVETDEDDEVREVDGPVRESWEVQLGTLSGYKTHILYSSDL